MNVTPVLTDAALADGRAFLRGLSSGALNLMLLTLLPSVRIGDAGPFTWAAIDAIRGELATRSGGEADGTSGE